MSNDGAEQLALVGARSLYANACITLVGIGIHLFMALYGLSVFLETPKELRKGRRRYIVLSFVFTILASLSACSDMAWIFQILFKATSADNFYEVLSEMYTVWMRGFSAVTIALGIFIGEALLVYRCYILLVNNRWVTIFPALMSVSSLVVFLVDEFATELHKNRTSNPLPTVTQMLTACTNVIVTSLITFHLFRMRRSISQMLPSQDSRLYTGVVSILIESALPLTLLGPITAGLQLAPFPKSPTAAQALVASYSIIGGLFYSFCTLSPHMIIFRVTTGRSWSRSPSSTNGASGGSPDVISRPINFIHQRTAESSFIMSQHQPAGTFDHGDGRGMNLKGNDEGLDTKGHELDEKSQV